jgi:hypothetical protein
MKMIKKIATFISIFLLYFIIKEFLALYTFTRSIHPWAGYATVVLIAIFIGYFIIIPISQILRLRPRYIPTTKRDDVEKLVQVRLKHFKTNRYLRESDFDFQSITWDEKGYRQITTFLKPEAERLRKKYITQLFYSTAIAQNGFLDAILILSSSINLVKDLFLLYHGRVSNRDLWKIAKMVYFSVAIGGSEGVEYATDEIFSKLTASSIKSIPFASRILGSLADGFINAALLARISLITEKYCQTLYLESERTLYPSLKTIVTTTRLITSDLIEKISGELKKMTKEKTGEILLMTVNPVGYVLSKAMTRIADTSDRLTLQQRASLQETAQIAHNPFGYGIRKVGEIFKKRNNVHFRKVKN